MRVLRHLPHHAAQAEARAEPVDQMRKLGVVIRRREPRLLRIAALGDERAKPHDVEAEARIDLVTDHVKPVGEQARDQARLAQRRSGAGLEAEHFPVGAEQHHLQQPRAFAALFEHMREAGGEPLDRAEHVTLMRDRLGKALLGQRGRNGQARRDRLILEPERLIDAPHERCAETCRERRARPVEHIGDMLEADLRQRRDGVGIEAQRREGKRRDRVSLFA